MEKIDYRKRLGMYYLPKAGPIVEVDVPGMNFLMIDGAGDPNSEGSFGEAVEALFSLSYALKFTLKKSSAGVDYGVMPLEGLWWADDMDNFTALDKSGWKWTLMVMQPDPVSRDMVEAARSRLAAGKNPAALSRLRFEFFAEGLSAQTLHIGPFSEEGPVIARIHDHIEQAGRKLRGSHHEIYLSDIRRARPDRWRTVLRQPMS